MNAAEKSKPTTPCILPEAITRLLARCDSDSSVLPPTELYSEGWMLRLVLDWVERNPTFEHCLSFAQGSRWFSEALLPSRFLPKVRGDVNNESFTHADGIIGHFEVASGKRARAEISQNAKQFIVTEAKLGSALSKGTKNALGYDQAARNVACIAYMVGKAQIAPSSFHCLAFYVLAPEAKIKSNTFADLVSAPSIKQKVKDRVHLYGEVHNEWYDKIFLPVLEQIKLGVLSWESIIAALPKNQETAAIASFYEKCLQFNLKSI